MSRTVDYEHMSEETKFDYLRQKLWQHTNHDVLKCVQYWKLLIELPFENAPAEYLDTFRKAKEYIKRELLL